MFFDLLKMTAHLLAIIAFGGCSLFLYPEIASDNASVFDYFWKVFDTQYALFELKKNLDWNTFRATYRDQAINAASDEELFSILSKMIAPLNDGHVWLYWPEGAGQYDSWTEPEIDGRNYTHSSDRVEPYLESLAKIGSGIVTYGKVKGKNIGYISISSFSLDFGGFTTYESWVYDVDRIIDNFMDTDALIIDLRGNIGGYRANALHIASRFVSERIHYMKTKVRTGPGHDDFGPITNHYIEPRGEIYTKTVYLVTDVQTVSAGEWFALMLKDTGSIEHIGWRTTGALGMVSFHELPNGWLFSTTIGSTTDENGVSYEEVGIIPDHGIKYDSEGDGDDVMEWIVDHRAE